LGTPDTLKLTSNLAALYEARARYSQAESLYKRVLAGFETALGREHPDTLTGINNLSSLYFVQSAWRDAAQY
jgi:Tetratricopeptide repeat